MIIEGEAVYNTPALPGARAGETGVPPLDRNASACVICARSAHDPDLVEPVRMD
jgi:hypothetical protein